MLGQSLPFGPVQTDEEGTTDPTRGLRYQTTRFAPQLTGELGAIGTH